MTGSCPAGWPALTLLDLDGTLVDTAPDIAWCTNEALAELGIRSRREDEIRQWIGNGSRLLLLRAMAGRLTDERAVEPEHLARAHTRFLELYAEHTSTRSQVYPGVREGLAWLRRAGSRLAVVTNKPTLHAVTVLRDLALAEDLDLVVGGDDVEAGKPDPEPLQHAMDELGVTSRSCLMIGDSVNDVLAARAAGVPVICVSYGYNHGRDIASAAPDGIVDNLSALPEAIERFQAALASTIRSAEPTVVDRGGAD